MSSSSRKITIIPEERSRRVLLFRSFFSAFRESLQMFLVWFVSFPHLFCVAQLAECTFDLSKSLCISPLAGAHLIVIVESIERQTCRKKLREQSWLFADERKLSLVFHPTQRRMWKLYRLGSPLQTPLRHKNNHNNQTAKSRVRKRHYENLLLRGAARMPFNLLLISVSKANARQTVKVFHWQKHLLDSPLFDVRQSSEWKQRFCANGEKANKRSECRRWFLLGLLPQATRTLSHFSHYSSSFNQLNQSKVKIISLRSLIH